MRRIIATLAAFLSIYAYSRCGTCVDPDSLADTIRLLDQNEPPEDKFVIIEVVEEFRVNCPTTLLAFEAQRSDQMDENHTQRQSKAEETNEFTITTAYPTPSTPEGGSELLSMTGESTGNAEPAYTSTSSITTTTQPPKESAEIPQYITSPPKATGTAHNPPKENMGTNPWLEIFEDRFLWTLLGGLLCALLGRALAWLLRRCLRRGRRRSLRRLLRDLDLGHDDLVFRILLAVLLLIYSSYVFFIAIRVIIMISAY